MPRNIELKVRLADPAPARATAERIATARGGLLEQTDTYFDTRRGRLKLRETVGRPAQLVGYERSDAARERPSDYQLVSVAEPEALKTLLAQAWGVRTVVHKRRELYFFHNVRLHLDEVTGLGWYLEFEAVLDAEHDEAAGRAQVAELIREFGLTPAQFEGRGYADLLDQSS